MKFQYNDGGRKEAGYKGKVGDCVTRAIAIATEQDYQTVYDALNVLAKSERKDKGRSSARNGVSKATTRKYLLNLGWVWVPTMFIGQGCKVHLRAHELPDDRLIVSVSKHLVAVINHVVHDTYKVDRNGTRCVYGYFQKPII